MDSILIEQGFLQVSHLVYFVCAYRAWKKGYKGFAGFLLVVIFTSIVHHVLEDKSHIFDLVEGNLMNAFVITTIVKFRKTISTNETLAAVACLGLNILAHFSKLRHNMVLYTLYHNAWHICTGFVLLNIIETN